MPATARKTLATEIDFSKLNLYQLPKEESVTLDSSRILDYDVRVHNNTQHFGAVYSTPVDPVEEKLGDCVKTYYTKPTGEQISFSQKLRESVSEEIKTNYNNAGFDYTGLIEIYNSAIANGKGVEDAYIFALRKLNPDMEFEIRSIFKKNEKTTKPDGVADVEYTSHVFGVVDAPVEYTQPAAEPVIDVPYRVKDTETTTPPDADNFDNTQPQQRDDFDLSVLDELPLGNIEPNIVSTGKKYEIEPITRINAGSQTDLKRLAVNYLGNESKWEILARYNGLNTENSVLQSDMEIGIPPHEYVSSRTRSRWWHFSR